MVKKSDQELITINTIIKIGGLITLISSFFITTNNILAKKADVETVKEVKTELKDFKKVQYAQHENTNLELKRHNKILIKLELMADIYLKQNKGGK